MFFFHLCKSRFFSIYVKTGLFISAKFSFFSLQKQFLVLQKQVLTIYALIIMIPTRYRACAAQPWSLREPSMRSGTSKRKWKSSTHRLIIIKCSQSWILDPDPAPPQVEELTNLKKIAEKQLEEALESLQAEREQRYLDCLPFLDCNAIVVDGDRGTSERSAWRISWFWPLHDMLCTIPCYDLTRYALKKELDSKNNSESMYQLGNLALSIQVRKSQKSQSVA